MKIYYMSEIIKSQFTATPKARNDLDTIFKQQNYKKIGLSVRSGRRKLLYKMCNFLSTRSILSKLSKLNGDVIIFQYPVMAGRVLYSEIEEISQKNKVIFVIHDLEYIRVPCGEEKRAKEVSILNKAAVLICHNQRMIERLKQDGVGLPHMVNLELFDYLIDCSYLSGHSCYGNQIAYAGNLKKGGFIDQLAEESSAFEFAIHLFGINFDGNCGKNMFYEGAFDPEELIVHLNYSFGLVWDSLDLHTCSGDLGNYTRYNNPHKLSLYIAAGLPVIVWSQSAAADFVKKYNIGIVIDSIYDIDEQIAQIDSDLYSHYQRNVTELRNKVISGTFTKNALQQAIRYCNHELSGDLS